MFTKTIHVMKENYPHPKFKMTSLQARYGFMKSDFIQNDKRLSLDFRRTLEYIWE